MEKIKKYFQCNTLFFIGVFLFVLFAFSGISFGSTSSDEKLELVIPNFDVDNIIEVSGVDTSVYPYHFLQLLVTDDISGRGKIYELKVVMVDEKYNLTIKPNGGVTEPINCVIITYQYYDWSSDFSFKKFNDPIYKNSYSLYGDDLTFYNSCGNLNIDISGYTASENYLIRTENNSVVFPEAPQGILTPIAREAPLAEVMKEVLGLIPIVIVTIVGLISLRKGLQLLSTVLHNS